MAKEALMEAIAMGADRCIFITDPVFAGADTLATSYTLARAIELKCSDFDLILCGSATSDSETAQVGPQLAEELNIPVVAYVSHFAWWGGSLRLKRLSDSFLETLEMDIPGLITVTTQSFKPRHIPIGGLIDAYDAADIQVIDAASLGSHQHKIGQRGSATKILKVYAASAKKQNAVMTGSPRKIVEELFANFEDFIGGAASKDLKPSKKK
jgi:electron transfer flavoprotein beta subunit